MQDVRTTIPKMVIANAAAWPQAVAQYSKDKEGVFRPTTYPELAEQMFITAAGLRSLGAGKSSLVGLVSENRKEWLLIDLGLLALGAADVPRGCDTMPAEIVYILKTVDAKLAVFENQSQLHKIVPHLSELPQLKTAILFDVPETGLPSVHGLNVRSFQELYETGREEVESAREAIRTSIEQTQPDDVATIIFTSGTTGQPKGVMLSHWNFLTQAFNIEDKIDVQPSDTWLCVLPVWHSFERIMQYVSLAHGSALAYSKPIGRIMLADFASIKPTWMASVPRIWESLRAGIYQKIQTEGGAKWALFRFFVAVGKAYTHQRSKLKGRLPRFRKRSRFLDAVLAFFPWLLLFPLKALGSVLVFSKIREKLGGRFVAGISGGGALPSYVDSFFSAAGILLLEGYGLTETAPVISVRTQKRPVSGTIGSPLRYTEAQVRGEDGAPLEPGKIGILWVRGPQIMLGYYKQPELTKKIMDSEGWLNTGDLAMLTWDGEIAIRGRAKDTIVLLGGENIEPSPMEAKLRESPYIDQAMIVGQDQKYLGVLIVANEEAVTAWAKENGVEAAEWKDLGETPEVNALIRGEISAAISTKNGFRTWEQISRFVLIAKPFEVGVELSGKQDLKRHVIADMYKNQIKSMFA